MAESCSYFPNRHLIRVFGGNERRLLEFDSAETGIYIVSQGGQPYFLKSRPAKYIRDRKSVV